MFCYCEALRYVLEHDIPGIRLVHGNVAPFHS